MEIGRDTNLWKTHCDMLWNMNNDTKDYYLFFKNKIKYSTVDQYKSLNHVNYGKDLREDIEYKNRYKIIFKNTYFVKNICYYIDDHSKLICKDYKNNEIIKSKNIEGNNSNLYFSSLFSLFIVQTNYTLECFDLNFTSLWKENINTQTTLMIKGKVILALMNGKMQMGIDLFTGKNLWSYLFEIKKSSNHEFLKTEFEKNVIFMNTHECFVFKFQSFSTLPTIESFRYHNFNKLSLQPNLLQFYFFHFLQDDRITRLNDILKIQDCKNYKSRTVYEPNSENFYFLTDNLEIFKINKKELYSNSSLEIKLIKLFEESDNNLVASNLFIYNDNLYFFLRKSKHQDINVYTLVSLEIKNEIKIKMKKQIFIADTDYDFISIINGKIFAFSDNSFVEFS